MDRAARVRALCEQVQAIPAEQQAAFLAAACGQDRALRTAVETQLEHTRSRLDEPSEPAAPGPAADVPAGGAARSDPAWAPGYQILRTLTRGGQGIVYEALQISTKRIVALKLVADGLQPSRAARRRFEREIELVAQLKHPNIITIFDSGVTADGRQFYAMDYVRGLPLHEYAREKRLALDEVLRLFAVICEAVQYAHQRGIIHRDLKPGNILVGQDGSPKILDFGLAKWLAAPVESHVSRTDEFVGTLPYVSPEQARGRSDEVDTRTDIYALGVILYELLTGQHPYSTTGELAQVLQTIAEVPPVPPARRWTPESGVAARSAGHARARACPIDDEVQTIVLRALAKEPERRYQSAGELARDVQHYLAGEPIEAKRDSGVYLLRKYLRRHARLVGVGTAFLVLVVAFAVTMSVEAQRSRALAQREAAARQEAQRRGAQALYNAGTAHESARRPLDAERAYRAALDVDPSFYSAWFNLGNVLRDLGRVEEAADAYRHAALLDSVNIRPLVNLAAMYRRHGRWEAALAAAVELQRREPTRLEWWTLRAEALDRLGRCQAALELYEQVAAQKPQDANALEKLAWFYLTAPEPGVRQPARALELMRRVKSLVPQDAARDNSLALACALNARFEEAQAALARSGAAGGENALDLAVLALCQAAQGEPEAAQATRARATTLGQALDPWLRVDFDRVLALAGAPAAGANP